MKTWKCGFYEKQNEKKKPSVHFFILWTISKSMVGRSLGARQQLQWDQLWTRYMTAMLVDSVKVKPTWNNLFMTQFIYGPRWESQLVPCLEDTGSKALRQKCTRCWHSSPFSSSKQAFTWRSLQVQAQTSQGEWRALKQQGQEMALRPASLRHLSGAGRCDTGG